MRALALRVFLLVISLAIFLGTGELALRVIYRDGGTTTLSGPGGKRFEYDYLHRQLRGRFDYGPKRPGVPRVLVIGDSITWGQGVRDWKQTWPELVAAACEREATPYEWSVLAAPGRDITGHVDEVKEWLRDLEPDIFIYQWYVNDIEAFYHRPENKRWWHELATHEPLQRWSYLYFFLDDRFSKLLPQSNRSYVDYIVQDFIPGSLEWSEFERKFHELMSRVNMYAKRRLMVLYPQVPFKGPYPLQAVHDRLRAYTGAHRLSIPPSAWVRWGGTPDYRPDARFGAILKVPGKSSGPLFDTRDYFLHPGANEVILTIALDEDAASATGVLELLDPNTHKALAAPLPWAASGRGWQEIKLMANVPQDKGTIFGFRLSASGGAAFSVASIDLPVDYGLEVIDLAETLNTFDTHASIFDAHPNEAAHRVMAEKIHEALKKSPLRH